MSKKYLKIHRLVDMGRKENITDVNEMYPHLTRTQAESLKNHFFKAFKLTYATAITHNWHKQHLEFSDCNFSKLHCLYKL